MTVVPPAIETCCLEKSAPMIVTHVPTETLKSPGEPVFVEYTVPRHVGCPLLTSPDMLNSPPVSR